MAEPEPPAGSWELPPAVVAAINDELGRIEGDSRLVLDAAAIVGESFEAELVAAIADRSVPATLAALDVLLEADIIRPTATPAPLPLSASDRAQGGLRRDASRVAARCPRSGGNGADGGGCYREHVCAPRRAVGHGG